MLSKQEEDQKKKSGVKKTKMFNVEVNSIKAQTSEPQDPNERSTSSTEEKKKNKDEPKIDENTIPYVPLDILLQLEKMFEELKQKGNDYMKDPKNKNHYLLNKKFK